MTHHHAMFRASADYTHADEDIGAEYTLDWLLKTTKEWDEPDMGVGHHGGWIVTARVIGAVLGDLVLDRDQAEFAFGKALFHVERYVSERLTEEVGA